MRKLNFLLTVAGYFAGDSTNRRGCDLTVGTDESGGSGAKDPQMLIKENNNSSFLTFVNKSVFTFNFLSFKGDF